jgi:dTDP-4-dehydrorhamnose reductase
MNRERVLITGCGGMLGAAVYPLFSQHYGSVLATDIDLNEPWLTHLDVRDVGACERVFAEFRPTLVVHLAALTDLEYCEKNAENCWLTNALGTENVALLARRAGSTMVYVSTAGIFDGKQERYNDFDLPNPLSLYGKSKYHGEQFVERFVPQYYVFRAGWMMGGGPRKDKKFVNKIYRQIKAGKKEIFAVDDKLGTPTYTANFAEGMLRVIPTGYYGLYNQVSTGGCSRFEVARAFVELLELSNQVRVTPVSSAYFADEYFAVRPYSEELVNTKLIARNVNVMKGWKECLAEYSRVFWTDYHERL